MKTELWSHRNRKTLTESEMEHEPDNLHKLAKDYGWKLFPLILLILVLLIPRFVAWVLGHIFTTLGEGCMKFLKVTEI
jgi:hypothetical protein